MIKIECEFVRVNRLLHSFISLGDDKFKFWISNGEIEKLNNFSQVLIRDKARLFAEDLEYAHDVQTLIVRLFQIFLK